MEDALKPRAPERNDEFDLDTLLHPARAFAHPAQVVRDRDLTLNEKRAILSSWASDACAVEAAPDLRATPSGHTVRWDDIMDALRLLDDQAAATRPPSRARLRKWRRWRETSGGTAGQNTQPG